MGGLEGKIKINLDQIITKRTTVVLCLRKTLSNSTIVVVVIILIIIIVIIIIITTITTYLYHFISITLIIVIIIILSHHPHHHQYYNITPSLRKFSKLTLPMLSEIVTSNYPSAAIVGYIRANQWKDYLLKPWLQMGFFK
jgi:sterol desaturase/sphingolipid hydroxylase (fatty acid hydroxylase superfamily)